jgi:putative ABC transport system permease protein
VHFIQDLTFSVRSLRKSPGFTSVAVLTLALGIAGNAVVFSFINATLLRPLPYPEPHRLVILRWQDQSDISTAAFFLVKRARSFSFATALYPVAGVNISSASGPPQYVKALPVSKDFFQTLGILPEIGVAFSAEQDQPYAPRTAVLSFGLWTREFNRDPSAVGHDLRVNGEDYKIIGIMPQGFRSYPDADFWIPLQLNPNDTDTGNNSRVIGRLSPGSSLQQAQYELDQLARQYHATYPWSAPQGTLVVHDLQGFLSEKERGGLTLLFAAVALVFLIACSNVAILILVRAAARIQPIAIRAALGSTRQRLFFSLLTESLLLSVIGGGLGLILAKELLPLLFSLWPRDLPLASKLSIDWHVVLFTFAISILSCLLFGLAPGLRLSRVNLLRALGSDSRTASASAEQVRTVHLLVFCQITLALTLLAGTLFLVTSLLNLYSAPLGFDPEHVVVAQVSLAGPRYSTTAATGRLLDEVVKQLELLPHVEAVAAVNGLPLENVLNLPVHPVDMPDSLDHAAEYAPVTQNYFSTLHIRLLSGRFFVSSDKAGSAPVAIINQTMATRWWPTTSAIGHYIRVDEKLGPQPPDGPRQIVGVVSDLHQKGPGVPSPASMFVPITQTPNNITAFFNKVFLSSVVVRTSRGVHPSDQIQSALRTVDPDLPLASLRPFPQLLDQFLANHRFITLLTTTFSAFALLLTAVGLYGLLNYQTGLRTREIAVRMAVGASRPQIIRMVVQEEIRQIFFALLAGMTGSFLIKKLPLALLYNVTGSSLKTILVAGLLLGSVAIAISLLTAVRAAFIEPVAVLKNE